MVASFTPTIQVSINGTQIEGLLRGSVVATNAFSADTFTLTFAIRVRETENIAFWSALASAIVEVGAVQNSPYGPDYNGLITGIIDAIRIDPVQGIVTIDGRDMSGQMVDSYRQQDFVNQTASEVVAAIASHHNLSPFVTATTGNVGRYYADGYTKLSLGQYSHLQSDWDLVVQLARQIGFDVFVQATSLYFQPSAPAAGPPIALALTDVQGLCVDRNISSALNPSAQVQSWNSHDMAAYSTPSGQASGTGDSSSLPFLFAGSNYTSQQVTDTASQYTAEIGRLTTVLRIEMPWNLTYVPRGIIMLTGTACDLDTTYRIDTVERRFSASLGSEQTVQACKI